MFFPPAPAPTSAAFWSLISFLDFSSSWMWALDVEYSQHSVWGIFPFLSPPLLFFPAFFSFYTFRLDNSIHFLHLKYHMHNRSFSNNIYKIIYIIYPKYLYEDLDPCIQMLLNIFLECFMGNTTHYFKLKSLFPLLQRGSDMAWCMLSTSTSCWSLRVWNDLWNLILLQH